MSRRSIRERIGFAFWVTVLFIPVVLVVFAYEIRGEQVPHPPPRWLWQLVNLIVLVELLGLAAAVGQWV